MPVSGAYFSRHPWAGSALLGAAFLLALGHVGPGVRACKVSLKVEERAPSGEPGQLGSGEAAPPVGDAGTSAGLLGFLFSLKLRWWRRAFCVWVRRTGLASPAGWQRDPAGSGMFLRAPQLAPGSPWPEAWGR